MYNYKNKGLSLFEIIIVIVIMGIIASVGIVFFGRSEPVLHLNSAADMLLADLTLARQRAVSRYDNSTSWEIDFSQSNQYTIRALQDNTEIPRHTQTKVLPQNIRFEYSGGDFNNLGGSWPSEITNAGITVDSAADFAGEDVIRFRSSGRAVNDNNADFNIGYIVMRNDQGNVKLFVITGMTGRIRVYTLFTDGTAFE